MNERDGAPVDVELRSVARALAPAVAGWAAANVLPIESGGLRFLAAVIAALAVAVVTSRRLLMRLLALGDWARRVRAGERVSPPLHAGGPDPIDAAASRASRRLVSRSSPGSARSVRSCIEG